MDFVFDADAAVEADEIGAAAEEDVLAVVDDFVDAGMQVGGGAAAEVAAALDELHAIAGFGEGAGGAHAGYAAADDGDGAWDGLLWRCVQVFLVARFQSERDQKQILRCTYPDDLSRCGAPSCSAQDDTAIRRKRSRLMGRVVLRQGGPFRLPGFRASGRWGR